MKTTIGGDRLGSGNKQEISLRNYERSTHDLSYLWRSSMAAGTLVPFMNIVGLPGDSFEIDLNCEVLTLPTIGPLFGSYKVQLDVFQTPVRLYNAGLHMNRLGIGMDMSAVKLPQMNLAANNHANYNHTYEDNEQVNSSSIYKYLGISGIGQINGTANPAVRAFNAVPLLAYWDIYKNYYANKQEERGFAIHTDEATYGANQAIQTGILNNGFTEIGDILDNPLPATAGTGINLIIQFPIDAVEPDPAAIQILINDNPYTVEEAWNFKTWDDDNKRLNCTTYLNAETGVVDWELQTGNIMPIDGKSSKVSIREFPLDNIDDMKEFILTQPYNAAVNIHSQAITPYVWTASSIGADDANRTFCIQYTQEGLGLKTYQSDLFNNWISTEWIDGVNGINEVTAVSTAGDSFTIDALNIANKVYNMLNRIAISGGSYDDWLDAVYTHERSKSIESPMYQGSLIKELAFEEVISNGESETDDNVMPLGTLAGRGRLTGKNKGGKIRVKVNEPCVIQGIVSLTPRIDYSQGNSWDMSLKTMNDFHKPALDAIGYQDLVTDQMVWSDTEDVDGVLTFKSAGKQPAWINYMTSINKVYGTFAEENNSMFMVLARRYEKEVNGDIADLTTYIDPTKFNHIFAQTSLDAQNFWVQISNNITARRKMSAKVIPNL